MQGDAYGRYLEMFDISTKSNQYTNLAKVTREESPRVVYLQVEKSTYKFDWDMIDEIQKTSPSNDDVTGVDDEIITITGKQYRGTIISQKIGNNIVIIDVVFKTFIFLFLILIIIPKIEITPLM